MELDHVFHPAHKLTYKKTVKSANNGEFCAACLDEISSSEHYSCGECNFFLHKLCAQLPLELTHSSHDPLHHLRLLPNTPDDDNETPYCDNCFQTVNGFIYHCEICDFDLDLSCALPTLKRDLSSFSGGSKLNHVCHRHILTCENKADKGAVCAACLDEISGRSTEYYSCRPCSFFLHKLCAEQPPMLKHYLHPSHPLQLLPKNSYDDEVEARCHACYKTLEGFVYHCELCPFDLDFICAFPNGKKLNYIFHPDHKLTREYVVKRADKKLVCAACLEEITGPLADYYSCRPCNFFLHKVCSQRPLSLTSSLHPEHSLRLLPKNPYDTRGKSFCFGCHKIMKGFVYDCLVCNGFHLDFKCAFPKPENRIQKYELLHHHPLIFQSRPAKFSCYVCSSTGDRYKEDQSYSCFTCDFSIHKMCAYLTLTQAYKDHQHPLSLVQGVPGDLKIYKDLSCDVCHYTVLPEDWASHCARCRYFVHIRCMLTDDTATGLISSINDGVDYLDDSFFKHLLKDDEFVIVHMPPRDISSELIRPFLIVKNGIVMNSQPTIHQYFSHNQHDMILFRELCVNTDYFFKEEDEEILCDACIHPITAPYYCCQECNYYLHFACANLPDKITHFSHPGEELELTCFSPYTPFRCDRCGKNCNGFGYWCEKCKFFLDLTCAALPGVIMHETHQHPLFQVKAGDDEELCYACDGYTDKGVLIFKCEPCEVYLHYSCAMYSRSLRHRWDRQHPILLRFPPHGDHPEHFMCDECEETIHPMRWLYSCFQCDVSFHKRCAPRYDKYDNIKYGGKVKISSHPHTLKFLRKPTLKLSCNKCEVSLGSSAVFECETCYYCICIKCGFSELL